MKKYFLPALALVALVYASMSVYSSRPVRKPVAPPGQPPTTVFPSSVAAVGLIEASSENIAVSTPVAGLVTKVFVKVGDPVKSGTRLFALDDRDLQAELALRRAALSVAVQRLEKLKSSPRPEEIPPAEARVREAETALADTKVQLDLMESVTDRRAIREEDLQRRRLAVKAAGARLDEAKSHLSLLKSGTWKPDLQIAQAEVAQGEALVRKTETDIERLTVRALVDGKILQSNVHPGEYAASGPMPKPLMVLGNVEALNIRTDVDENDAAKIRAGQPAVAFVRGKGEVKIPLEFVRFEPYVVPKKSLTGDSVERVDTRVLQVVYRIAGNQEGLYVGQQVDVFIDSTVK
ncbi:MAG: efflux RND transporter periplasmic adaptor subunit [Blastocatellia bacterium]|nr:efflux RND transporter periplasmic adaptor subunit [Blastocatellia bacterium]